MIGLDVRLWAAVFSILAIGFIWLPDLYGKVEILVKIVVGVMIVAFIGTLAIVGTNVQLVATGLVPSFPDIDAVFLALGMAATTFSIAAAVYQSHLMKEKGWGPEELPTQGLDSILGIAVLGLLATVILLTSARVIWEGPGDPVFDAAGMACQLEPIVGPGAFWLFTLGFFFAALSSLVVNALIGATLLVDGYGRDPSMDGRPVKLWSSVAILFGLAVVLVFQEDPIEILRIAQAMAVIAFPVLGFLVVAIAADRDLMGEHANGLVANTLGILGYLAIIGIVLNYVREVLLQIGVL